MKKTIPIEKERLISLKGYSMGQRLKWIRAWNNHTQMDFAELVGIKQNTVSLWENDLRMPNQKNIAKIVIVYHLPNDFFMDIPRQKNKYS